MKQYDKGYLAGQLDEAESAYENVQSIIDNLIQSGCVKDSDREFHMYIYLKDLENFLKEHGRLADE